jgi:uncharacterized membrane protein YhdT
MAIIIEFALKFDAIWIYICTIPQITILGYSDHQTDSMMEFTPKFDAICIYICTIPQITILGYSDHQTDVMIEFALKFDAICIYSGQQNHSNVFHFWKDIFTPLEINMGKS